MTSPRSTPKPADPFHTLWIQLQECHQKGLQELEEKVCKLKKERRLDAESLQLFYSRNQELKEENKTLQDANSLLEHRLRTRDCDRCATLEENLKNCQDYSEQTITKLKHERKCLEDENSKLHAEVQLLRACSKPLVANSPEHEVGFIPDSPVMASSLPVANKKKKRKYTDNSKHVHYAEAPSFKFNKSLFKDIESSDASKNAKRAQVLVPNTCQMETSHILDEENGEVIAETCGLELNTSHVKTTAAIQQSSAKSPQLADVRLKPRRISSSPQAVYSPDSTTAKSPSIVPHSEKVTDMNRTGKKKLEKDDGPKKLEEGQTCDQGNGKKFDIQVELMKKTSKTISAKSLKEPADSKVPNQMVGDECESPAFKKPNMKPKEQAHHKRSHLQVQNASLKRAHTEAERKHRVENMWSIDPAINLSMYDTEQGADEHEELLDSDRTWISHSMLPRRGEEDLDEQTVSGIGDKANDSLDRMFDTTSHEEYISYNSSQVASHPCEDHEEKEDEQESPGLSPVRKTRHPTFAHVAVVRKKDERRKLKGTTCKECEIYYMHLPEEEKQKKLSECSRHRHLFLPPNTPENFWEVGFPSTQTCVERGYIKEEKIPQSRLRRKQPFLALFSPKCSQQET
ncbi:DNA endonuclease RBBP8 isoform X2 [Corythoichthys intestinalis]|uniref:DNA endonuclease RBBP8 isoform X2 n=1 Tax=Corythoichthys intestinalis TaxID=161448 RepID=UPI0025A59240|nr:DNA endonuclease RBBP8 isoform X2 [Corythoichthys intestinalis]